MVVRVLTLLLTVALALGASTQFAWAADADDAASSVDDDHADDAAVIATTVALPDRDSHPETFVCDVASLPGRLHAVSVFRPPRVVTSR